MSRPDARGHDERLTARNTGIQHAATESPGSISHTYSHHVQERRYEAAISQDVPGYAQTASSPRANQGSRPDTQQYEESIDPHYRANLAGYQYQLDDRYQRTASFVQYGQPYYPGARYPLSSIEAERSGIKYADNSIKSFDKQFSRTANIEASPAEIRRSDRPLVYTQGNNPNYASYPSYIDYPSQFDISSWNIPRGDKPLGHQRNNPNYTSHFSYITLPPVSSSEPPGPATQSGKNSPSANKTRDARFMTSLPTRGVEERQEAGTSGSQWFHSAQADVSEDDFFCFNSAQPSEWDFDGEDSDREDSGRGEFDQESSTDSRDKSSSIDQGSSPSAVAEGKKNRILDHLMSKLQEWLEVNLQKRGAQNGQQASSHGSAPTVTIPGRSDRSSGSQGIKKRRRNDSDDENGDRTPDRDQTKGGKPTNDVEMRYVCPYFMHNREKYQKWKTCCLPGFPTINRLKEHLYRRHLLPKFRCNRCRRDLGTASNLNEHQRAQTVCQIQDEELEEDRINDEQEKRLRVRRRQMGEEEKWVEIYKIIFPHDHPIPSPYEQPGANVSDFGNYVLREFSRRVRPRVENLVNGALQQTLTPQAIADITNDTLRNIIQPFRASQAQAVCQPETEELPSRGPNLQGVLDEDTPLAPQDGNGIENGDLSDFDPTWKEILEDLDNNHQLYFELGPIEAEDVNTVQSSGSQVN